MNVLEPNSQPNSSHEIVDTHISSCIKLLLTNPQPATWLHCDAIALGFCSNLLLQQAQAQHLAKLPPLSELHEQKDKADPALRYGRRMAWDMIKNAVAKIGSKEEVTRLPLAKLCCVFRAGVAVLETAGACEEQRLNAGD